MNTSCEWFFLEILCNSKVIAVFPKLHVQKCYHINTTATKELVIYDVILIFITYTTYAFLNKIVTMVCCVNIPLFTRTFNKAIKILKCTYRTNWKSTVQVPQHHLFIHNMHLEKTTTKKTGKTTSPEKKKTLIFWRHAAKKTLPVITDGKHNLQ